MLGILGGGQLGLMFTQAAQAMGYKVCLFAPEKNSPTSKIADLHICADYTDSSAAAQFAAICKRASIEFENIPAQTIALLEQLGCHVSPNSNCVALIQNRITEKALIRSCFQESKIDVAPYTVIENKFDFENLPNTLFPGIIKTARMGYDGKGQIKVKNRDEAFRAWEAIGRNNCVLELNIPLAYEVSVILACDENKQYVNYPIIENIHKNGILHTSTMPARCVNERQSSAIVRAAKIIANKINYDGVISFEFFILQNGGILINEIAPRPHNSGHITLNACVASQFEQQARIVARLPLADTKAIYYGKMLNLLGDLWLNSNYINDTNQNVKNLKEVQAIPGAYLKLYDKEKACLGRKMGHLNLVATSFTQIQTAYKLAKTLLFR